MTDGALGAIIGEAASARGLRPRADIREAGWTFWELKNLNIHRVVGLLHDERPIAGVADLGTEIRAAFARNFHRSWWRGLAFGAIAEVRAVDWTPDDLASLIDITENRRGVLQWVVLVAADGRDAIGMHTWEQAFLSPVYQATLASLEARGCSVATAVRERSGLLRFLTAVSAWQGVRFPEFGSRGASASPGGPTPAGGSAPGDAGSPAPWTPSSSDDAASAPDEHATAPGDAARGRTRR